MEEKKIKVTLIRSEITQPETQRRTLRGLGLTRMNRTEGAQRHARHPGNDPQGFPFGESG